MSRVPVLILDWDGTVVRKAWPGMGDFFPGAVRNLRKLHEAGVHMKVSSARLNPYDPFTMIERDPNLQYQNVQQVRGMLDNAGLSFIDIWTLAGKPGGDAYLDDRAIWFPGRDRSWDIIYPKIMHRLGMETDGDLPVFDQEVARDARNRG